MVGYEELLIKEAKCWRRRCISFINKIKKVKKHKAVINCECKKIKFCNREVYWCYYEVKTKTGSYKFNFIL